MKKTALVVLILISVNTVFGQMAITIKLKEPLAGICDTANVYALFPRFGGQVAAIPSISKPDLEEQVNTSSTVLKENLSYKDKGSVTFIVNCRGELLSCTVKTDKGNKKLEEDLKKIFASLNTWKAGTFKQQKVDSELSYFFKVKKGIFKFS